MAADTSVPTARLIPSTRFTLALLVSFSLFIQYAQRVSLTMSIVCMVSKTQTNTPPQSSNNTIIKYGSHLLHDKQFPWTELQQQILLGAYWFGYIFTLVPGGALSISLGSKRMFAGSILLSSLATMGICSIYFMENFNFYVALLFRAIIGFTHGPLFPASYTLWSVWAVPLEKSTLTAIGFCSNNFGTSVTMLVGGILCRYVSSGWVYIFLMTALFGFLWLPLWLWLVADSPQTHKTISEGERNYICKNIGIGPDDKKKKVIPLSSLPWKRLVRSKPIIALFITECCNLFGLFFFYTNIGKILKDVHRIPAQNVGYVLAGGFVLMPFSSLTAGIVADMLIRRKLITTTTARKLFNSLASFIPALCMIVLCFCDHTRPILAIATILVFLISSALAYGSGYIVNFGDVLPAYSSIVFGIATAAATVGALMGNLIAGFVIKKSVLSDWRKLFILFAIIYVIGGVAFAALGSAKPRTWATFKAHELRQAKAIKQDEEEEAVPMQRVEPAT